MAARRRARGFGTSRGSCARRGGSSGYTDGRLGSCSCPLLLQPRNPVAVPFSRPGGITFLEVTGKGATLFSRCSQNHLIASREERHVARICAAGSTSLGRKPISTIVPILKWLAKKNGDARRGYELQPMKKGCPCPGRRRCEEHQSGAHI